MSTKSIKKTPEWMALQTHHQGISTHSIRQLFAQDPTRSSAFSAQLGGLWVDYSKHLISHKTLELLIQLAKRAELGQWRKRLFAGEIINISEQQAASHYVWRNPDLRQSTKRTPGAGNFEEVAQFAEAVRRGQHCGAQGTPFKHVLSIGIGGSYNGNRLLCHALRHLIGDVTIHFVDPSDRQKIKQLCARLLPQETLCITISKSFSTPEVRHAFDLVYAWFEAFYQDPTKTWQHHIAVSANEQAMIEWGFSQQQRFVMPQSIGGRYSIWSAAALPTMIAIGQENYTEFLKGGYCVDEHFINEPLQNNLPVLLGLINLWYVNFYATRSRAVLNYEPLLENWLVYLQQLEMESNGKCVTQDKQSCDYATAPVIWGGDGLHSQHTFFQLLRQSSEMIPCEFITTVNSPSISTETKQHNDLLMRNFLAQVHALAMGDDADTSDSASSLCCPVTAVLMQDLSPATLGSLITLYEHQTFVQAMVWGINPFDQL